MRKVRDSLESLTERIPRGPLGIAGEGVLIGGAGFFVVSAINGVNPLDDIDVGFNIESSSVQRFGDDEQRHTFVINAVSRDVAKFAAVFSSRPSIVDSVVRVAEVEEIDLIEERRWMSDWRVQVRVTNKAS